MSDQNDKYHVYDGIVEHDNPLPNWWLWTFLITIIFSALYFLHYEVSGAPTLEDELKVSMQEIEKRQAAHMQVQPLETEEFLMKEFERQELAAVGASEYQNKCAACHGQDLQGLIGPNLTDKFWLHGEGLRTGIVKVIRDGVAEKGMPPWGPMLKKDEIYALAAFIHSKRGTNPAGAKAPQGDAVESYLEGK